MNAVMEPPRGLELRRVDAANEQEVREYAEVCALFGLSLLPEFRRRGIQQALIAARLNSASVRGARLATIGSKPGAETERNVRRMGFATAYTKPVMVRPGPGLSGHVS